MKIYNFDFGVLVVWLNFNLSKFEFWKTSSNQILEPQMISIEKVMNTKVVQLIKFYNFYFDHVIIWLIFNSSNLKFEK
jgi:hypothetical protein